MKPRIEQTLRVEAARKIYEALWQCCFTKLIYGNLGAAAYGVHPDGVIECLYVPYTDEGDTMSQHCIAMRYVREMAEREAQR